MTISTNKIQFIPAVATREGAGVTVHRTVGSSTLRELDPFLLLDQISSDQPEDYIAGFPSHPHRGFTTLTYMLDGHMTHEDSLGNRGDLGPGAAQWMKAASGVIHSEIPRQKNGLLRGFQLWINLPAAHKMDLPEYQEYPASAFPVVNTPGYTVKVVAGNFSGTAAPIKDNLTSMTFLDVQVQPGERFRFDTPAAQNHFLYVYEGSGRLNGHDIFSQLLVIPNANGSSAEFVADKQGARFLAISGKPIHESIARYGPFVMNTHEEIEQAVIDYQSNRLVRNQAQLQQ